MVYRGTVRNGHVELENGERLPEGSRVRIELEPSCEASQETAAVPPELATFWTSLQAMAGTARHLPPDIAENHDHYLYGTPRK